MAGVKGDFAKLREARQRLERLGSPAFRTELAQLLAVTALKQASDGFRNSVDPYGKAWKPVTRNRKRDKRARASRARRGLAAKADKPLMASGRLRMAFAPTKTSFTSSPNGFRLNVPVVYASFHQEGTRHIARRMMLPDQTQGLGAKWTAAFKKETDAHIKRTLKGGK